MHVSIRTSCNNTFYGLTYDDGLKIAYIRGSVKLKLHGSLSQFQEKHGLAGVLGHNSHYRGLLGVRIDGSY